MGEARRRPPLALQHWGQCPRPGQILLPHPTPLHTGTGEMVWCLQVEPWDRASGLWQPSNPTLSFTDGQREAQRRKRNFLSNGSQAIFISTADWAPCLPSRGEEVISLRLCDFSQERIPVALGTEPSSPALKTTLFMIVYSPSSCSSQLEMHFGTARRSLGTFSASVPSHVPFPLPGMHLPLCSS